MSQHTIELELIGSDGEKQVRADKNPLDRVEAGDTVTWRFPPDQFGRQMRVVFKEFQPRDGSKSAAPPADGPFSTLSPAADRIVGTVSGTVEQGRYIYEVFAGDTRLMWANPMRGGGNFGGLDVPQPPGG